MPAATVKPAPPAKRAYSKLQVLVLLNAKPFCYYDNYPTLRNSNLVHPQKRASSRKIFKGATFFLALPPPVSLRLSRGECRLAFVRSGSFSQRSCWRFIHLVATGNNKGVAVKSHARPIGRYLTCLPVAASFPSSRYILASPYLRQSRGWSRGGGGGGGGCWLAVRRHQSDAMCRGVASR